MFELEDRRAIFAREKFIGNNTNVRALKDGVCKWTKTQFGCSHVFKGKVF